jgi:hypothetical protein
LKIFSYIKTTTLKKAGKYVKKKPFLRQENPEHAAQDSDRKTDVLIGFEAQHDGFPQELVW